MAKKAKQLDEKLIIDEYNNGNCSMRSLSKKYQVSSTRVEKIIRNSGSERYKRNVERHVPKSGSWNKGKSKFTDAKIAEYSASLSKVRSRDRRRSGYKTFYSEELKKSVKIHDYVYFKSTGAWPNSLAGEQVHHIDGDKDNNEISNLFLTDAKEHSKIHKQYEEVFFLLYRQDLIKFSKEQRGVDWESVNQLIKKLKEFT
jgi:hypothetical protein